ncbi:hypothetical protein FB472_1269 [Rhodoglobus vestalii]|uniref:Uncharacterized protein n=1 Tax=Rhodoglobus vestalii TaxID=193384 RepID=A0A8H2KAI3_9MICO|nr:hypothetical protein [Rhodoglobus vestalii]TQO19696.1 hypothetical protein FB472_1269 [Rhodoglobus vestalii]
MPKAKSMTKTPAAKRTPTRTKNGRDSVTLPVQWTATEYVPRKRWWWFIGLVLVAAWFSLLMIALREWSVLAFIVAATLTMLVTYVPRARDQKWTLKMTSLSVDKTTVQLENYRAFTIEELPGTKAIAPRPSITLLPMRRLGWPFSVYLPASEETTAGIIEALEVVLPYNDAVSYQTSTRILQRLTRWLRLG